MTNEQEIRAKALEIAAKIVGPNFPVLFQNKDGKLNIHAGFERTVKGVERYLNGEQPETFELSQDELNEVLMRFAESKT
jgi:hypothetical protein